MNFGISPNRIVTVPLGDYNSDYYLTLLYQAMLNLGWDIGYFDHDGIIAYTKISWESYSEEVSARVKDNNIIIKSECVGYQAWFFDYGKNKKNLDLLFGEIEYAEFHLQNNLEQTTQALMNEVPEKQFLSLDDPPMDGKEQLRGFFSPFVPRKKYFITPLLLILNTAIFILTFFTLDILLKDSHGQIKLDAAETVFDKLYMLFGANNRAQVLHGQVWRLVTSTFLHLSWLHLIFNMIPLVYVGSLIECKLGKWNYLLMYLYTGIIASMASVIWTSASISAGASGAIFGLFGILLALVSTDFYERSARKALLISTVIVVAYNILPLAKGVDHAAHFGGLLSGYLFGWMAYLGLSHKNLFIKKWGIALAGAVFVCAFVSCGMLFSHQYQTKEFAALIQKAEKMELEINSEFYNNIDSVTRQKKLEMLEQLALPEVKDLKKTGDKLKRLVLPSKQRKAAEVMAKLIDLECQLYHQVYLEFKDENYSKYRPAIDSLTNEVNDVRDDWAKENGD